VELDAESLHCTVVLCCIRDATVSAEEYRHRAAKCLEIADHSNDESVRLRLIDMAHAWLRLSEQAEKNARADMVYETPSDLDRAPFA